MSLIRISRTIQLAFDCFGDSSQSAVILVPGAGAPAEFFPAEFCETLAAGGWQVVRYSHRDTSSSTHLESHYGIVDLLGDLHNLIKSLELGAVHLVGHSMGGYLTAMALCEPTFSVLSGVIISAGPTVAIDDNESLGLSEPDPALWPQLMENVPSGDFEADLPGWIKAWQILHGAMPIDDAMARAYTAVLYAHDPRNCQVATHHVEAMSTVPSDLPARLPDALQPALVIHGTQDPLVPVSHGRALAGLLPNAHLVELAGVGHMFFNPIIWARISEEVLQHLDRSAGPRNGHTD